MFTSQEIVSVAMMLIGLASLAVSAFFSSKRHSRETTDAEIEAKVQMERIASTTESTQRDVREMKGSMERLDTKIDKHDNRIFAVEKEQQTMWRRIDEHTEDIKSIKEAS